MSLFSYLRRYSRHSPSNYYPIPNPINKNSKPKPPHHTQPHSIPLSPTYHTIHTRQVDIVDVPLRDNRAMFSSRPAPTPREAHATAHELSLIASEYSPVWRSFFFSRLFLVALSLFFAVFWVVVESPVVRSSSLVAYAPCGVWEAFVGVGGGSVGISRRAG